MSISFAYWMRPKQLHSGSLAAPAGEAGVVGQKGSAVAAPRGERALLAEGKAAAGLAVVAVRTGGRRAAVAARHARLVELAAVVLGRDAVAAILTRVGAARLRRLDAAHVAFRVADAAARRPRAEADRRA